MTKDFRSYLSLYDFIGNGLNTTCRHYRDYSKAIVAMSSSVIVLLLKGLVGYGL